VLTPIPALLACVGTGLTALAVFAPGRPRAATVSFAPPLAPPPLDRWNAGPSGEVEPPAPPPAARWPALVDPRADGSDVAVRLALVEALAALATPWAGGILRCALDEDGEPQVRAAAGAAIDAAVLGRRPRVEADDLAARDDVLA
jgi:hypothetical protein